jgi:hypothetical protein
METQSRSAAAPAVAATAPTSASSAVVVGVSLYGAIVLIELHHVLNEIPRRWHQLSYGQTQNPRSQLALAGCTSITHLKMPKGFDSRHLTHV